jgi:hypothetical protein
MSLLTNQTSLNNSEFFFLRGSGQQINVSSLNANTISTNTITANSSIANQLSTILLDANDINASTIFAYEVFIDNQGLTATPSELLLNGIPLATTANLSSIQDWATFPAISTLDMNGYNILSTNNVVASNVNAGTGIFNTLFANNIFALSTYTSTISSLAEVADFAFINALSTGSATGGNFAPSSLWGQPSSFYQDLVSTISSFGSDNIVCSTLTAQSFISTPDIEVSTINGAQFGNSSITVEIVGVSTLVADSISSAGAVLREALVSTLQFNPSFNPSLDVNLGLGSLFGNLAGAAAGGIGVLVGAAGLGTGIAALAQGRQTNNINSNSYELVNGTTQLQVSTLGEAFSTVYRFVSSISPDVPGQEIFVSTIYPAGLAIRSLSDPLNTVSSPNSTIQSFGQWVSLAETTEAVSTFNVLNTSTLNTSTITVQGQIIIEPSTTRSGVYMPYDATNGTGVVAVGLSTSASIYEKYAALLAITAQPFGVVGTQEIAAFLQTDDNEVTFNYADLEVGRLFVGGKNNYGTNPTGYITGDVIGNLSADCASFTASTFVASTIRLAPSSVLYSQSTDAEVVCGTASDPNDFAQIAASALRLTSSSGASNGIHFYNSAANRAGFLDGNASTFNLAYTNDSNISVSSLTNVSSLAFAGISTVTFATAAAAGINGQTAGRLVMSGNDLDLGQNDLWAQQLRIGAGNPGGSAQTEIVFYSPDAVTQRGISLGGSDLTIRVQSTINSGTNNGYLLDTTINRPFFSTINAGTSTALFAVFPSTNLGSFGASTLSVIPNPIFVAAANSLSSQQVLAANTPLALDLGSLGVNVGGYTVQRSTITVPVAGTYQFSPSLQFNTTSGGQNVVDFWFTKNGADLANSASRVSVANNAENLGTIVLYDTAAAGDQYGMKIASADANMEVGFFQSTITTPYTRPAIPSIILNAQRVA